jgi:tetratricopeptide (TPR) repeat protein
MTDAVTQPDWQTQLDEGRALEALRSYDVTPDPDPAVLSALETLTEIQVALRDKQPSRAQKLLAERAPDAAQVVNWQQLSAELEVLASSHKLLEQREPEQALETLSQDFMPILGAEAYVLRGTAHIYMNNLDAARAAFDTALIYDPKHYRALTNLGNIELEEGNTDKAIIAYESSLKLNEDFANTHHNLGVAYRRAGQIGKSVKALRKAQNMSNKQMRAEAKEALAGSTFKLNGKVVRYVLWGAGAVIVYFILQAQGIL